MILTSAVAACKKGSQTPSGLVPGAVPYAQGSGLYISGIASVGDSTGVAVVWHNGAVSVLGPTSSYAYYITAQGSDVYIGGRSGSNVVYWKNGVMSALLPTPTFASLQMSGIAVQGNDVYQSGYITNRSNFVITPLYWKNGALNYLSYDPNKFIYGSFTSGIAVTNTDVYVLDGNSYWKNSQFINFTTSDLGASAMTTSGTDIYIAGETSRTASGYGVGFWKNGVYKFLLNTDLLITSMTVHGTDVYIAGNVESSVDPQQQGAYLKNGTLTTLPIPAGYARSTVNSIYVDNSNNVYVTGLLWDSNGNRGVGVYWKNGVPTILGLKYNITGIVYVP